MFLYFYRPRAFVCELMHMLDCDGIDNMFKMLPYVIVVSTECQMCFRAESIGNMNEWVGKTKHVLLLLPIYDPGLKMLERY